MKYAVRRVLVFLLIMLACSCVACKKETNPEKKDKPADNTVVDENNDVEEDQRTVVYAQLVVGTYVDILNTCDFQKTLVDYLNGDVSHEREYSPEGRKRVVDLRIRQAIYEDGGLAEGGKLDEAIDHLIDEGFLDEGNRNRSVADVARDYLIMSGEHSDEQFEEEIDKEIQNGTIRPDYEYTEKELFKGPTTAEWEEIQSIREVLGDKKYDFKSFDEMLGFATDKESFGFDLIIKSKDTKEAAAIARVCKIIAPAYIEERYPGSLSITSSGVYTYKDGFDIKGKYVRFDFSPEELTERFLKTQAMQS